MTNNSAQVRVKENFDAAQHNAAAALQGADIVAYQEVDFDAARSFNTDQLAELSKAIRTPYAYSSVNWDVRYVPFPNWPPSAHFGKVVSGQAIASRYPLDTPETVKLQRVESQPFWYSAFYLDRLLQIAIVNLPQHPVLVMNVHLEAFDAPTRKLQVDQVIEQYKRFAGKMPVLLVGDFNSSPPSITNTKSEVEYLINQTGLTSACPPSYYHLPASYTYPSEAPSVQIDWIFYDSRFIAPVEWHVVSTAGTASDHLPLAFSFTLNNANTTSGLVK